MLLHSGITLLLKQGKELECSFPQTDRFLARVYRIRWQAEKHLLQCLVSYPSLPQDHPSQGQCLAEQRDIRYFLRDLPHLLKQVEFSIVQEKEQKALSRAE